VTAAPLVRTSNGVKIEMVFFVFQRSKLALHINGKKKKSAQITFAGRPGKGE
jgi:hypothetical protein